MTNSIYGRILATTARPFWAPADEGSPGADGAGTTGTEKTGEAAAAAVTPEVVLGGTDPAAKPADGKTALDDDASKDGVKPEPTAEEKAAADAEAKANTVPEDGVYEFVLPEGVELPDDKKSFWSKEFKDAGLTQKQAARMIELQAGAVLAQVAAEAKELETQQAEHLKAAKADKEIGGQKWDETVKLANIGLKALGGEQIKQLILVTGNGNNPEMLRELRRIGEKFVDDKFEPGPSVQAAVPTEKQWYGETTPETKKG